MRVLQASILNPKPQTLNPKPKALNQDFLGAMSFSGLGVCEFKGPRVPKEAWRLEPRIQHCKFRVLGLAFGVEAFRV